jgi:hypothetical protein
MPSLLRSIACRSCGHRHQFCSPCGSLTSGGEYAYVCPETGAPATLTAEDAGLIVRHLPQGAVVLMPAIERRAA